MFSSNTLHSAIWASRNTWRDDEWNKPIWGEFALTKESQNWKKKWILNLDFLTWMLNYSTVSSVLILPPAWTVNQRQMYKLYTKGRHWIHLLPHLSKGSYSTKLEVNLLCVNLKSLMPSLQPLSLSQCCWWLFLKVLRAISSSVTFSFCNSAMTCL